MSCTLSQNFGSLESLKLRVRCGLSSCAAQMRCTLEWLRPTALAILRSDQCVPCGRLSLSVMVTTRAIVAAFQRWLAARSGGVPFEAGDAARQIPIPPPVSGSLGLAG